MRASVTMRDRDTGDLLDKRIVDFATEARANRRIEATQLLMAKRHGLPLDRVQVTLNELPKRPRSTVNLAADVAA